MYEEIGKKFRLSYSKEIQEGYHLDPPEKDPSKGLKGETPDFAKAIKYLRSHAGYSLDQLSELTGINKQTLHSIENYSIRNPSFANLEKIATAFNTDLNDLILLARSEFEGNLFKTTATKRWTVSFEVEKGFSVHSYSPPGASRRDFFIGVMTIQGGKKLRYWQFIANAKGCIQPWDGEVLFVYHGMQWRKEVRVLANETLYFDASIPHTFENLLETANRVLLITHPTIF